jgi:hypothetical protein
MNVTNSIMALRQMAYSPQYAVRKNILLEAACDLENLQAELKQERARLDWLLPRQHSHHTRQSIDKELADPT